MKPHFSLLGFPVRVQPFFFLIIVMLNLPAQGGITRETILRTAIWGAVVFVSILWHEVGHALMMRRYGYTPWIELYGMGGRTGWGRGPGYPSPKVRILVSLAGPMAGFVLGGVVWLMTLALAGKHPLVDEALMGLLWVNIGWGLVNLVPMLPWDGGLAVHGAFDLMTKGKGLKLAGGVTLFVAALCGIALWVLRPSGASFWLWFLLLVSVERGVRAVRAPKPPPEQKAPPKYILRALRQSLDGSDANTLVNTILSQRKQPAWLEHGAVVRRHADTLESGKPEALELSAWAFLMGGDSASAKEAVQAMLPKHEPSVPLDALIAINDERFEHIVNLRERHPDVLPDTLLVYALWALGKYDESWALIRDRDHGHTVDAALFYRNRFIDSALLAERLFEAYAHPSDAFNAACSYSRIEDEAAGLMWLERALKSGLEDRAQIDKDADLEYLRGFPEFQRIRNA